MIKFLAIPMICSVMSGPVMKDVSYHHEYGPQEAVVYNDDDYEITLDVTETNDYIWENLHGYLYNNASGITGIDYNNIAFIPDDTDSDENFVRLLFVEETDSSYYQIGFNYWEDNYKFQYADSENNLHDFEYDLVLTFSSSDYVDLKQAIELDIQANQTSSMPSIQDLFSQVTAAINAFIGSLGDAFTQVTALFWDSTATTPGPTFLGLLVLIGVGVGLVYAAYRVIKGLLHRI